MKRILALTILVTTLFGGIIATDHTASAAECPATNGNAVEIAPSKSVQAGDCYLTEVVDWSHKPITIETGVADQNFTFTVGGNRNAWVGYLSVDDARLAACNGLIPSRKSDSAFAGFTITIAPIDCNGNVVVPVVSDCDVFNPGAADNAVTPGTTIPSGACAVVEVIDHDNEVITLTGGRLTAPFTVSQDHNAWAGFRNSAEAKDAACVVGRNRVGDPFFQAFLVDNNPNCDWSACTASSLPSGTAVSEAPVVGTCVLREVIDFESKRVNLYVGPQPAFVNNEEVNTWVYQRPGSALLAACREHIPHREAEFKDFEIRKDFKCPTTSYRIGGIARD